MSQTNETNTKVNKGRYEEIHNDEIQLHGAYFPVKDSNKAIILMLGDSYKDRMARCGAKYLNKYGINVLTLGTCYDADYTHVCVPIERFYGAIEFLKQKGNVKFGVAGASTTGMDALIASSYYSEISLTIAISPSDFVMEGFIRDNLDGAKERPADTSTTSHEGKPLPYLPFAYRHPEYYNQILKEAKDGGDFIASRKLFDKSEELHPLSEEELIKVENIKGTIVLIGAEDDVLWDTVRYINRMNKRIKDKGSEARVYNLTYKYGTHFAFPQKLLDMILPVFGWLLIRLFKSGKIHGKECKQTRIDIENTLAKILYDWKN